MFFNSKKYTAWSLMAPLLIILTGCSSDSPAPPEEDLEPVKEEQLTLCLNLSYDGQSTATRAENDPDRYDQPEGDFEKINEIRVIIVRSLNEDKSTGVIEANRLVTTNDQGRPLYDNLEFTVVANEYKRIYLIANEKFLTPPSSFTSSINPTASKFLDTFMPTKKGDTPKRVDLTDLSNWTVALPGLTLTTTTVSTGLFDPSNERRLPLTEFFDIYVDREKAIDDIINSHLFLTRAAAKAKFFLKVGENYANDGAVTPRIKSISLSGIGATEYVFPKNAEYSTPKADLLKADASLEVYINKFDTPSDRTLTYLIDNINRDLVVTPGDDPVALTNYIYFPESKLASKKEYEVTVTFTNGRTLSAPLTTNILKINESNAIARDTYLPIEITFNGVADITVEVIPWTPEYYEFDYTDNVAMADDGELSFVLGTYASYSESTARLVLNDFPNAAIGNFGISQPVGGKWDAYLVTTEGDPDVIQFENADGTTSSHISGKIEDGKKIEVKVRSTMSAGSSVRSAIMQVTVTMPGEFPITVPVNVLKAGVEGASSGPANVTFIQNPK